MASTMTRTTKRSRDPLSPKPILDRRLLTEALTERGIELKPARIDQFYQLLHRQHYPSLEEFVDTYNKRERMRLGIGSECSTDGTTVTATGPLHADKQEEQQAPPPPPPQQQHRQDRPFPNPVSAKASKQNLHLLPKALLSFLADPSNGFVTLTSKVADSRLSSDGTTTKMAVQLQDGHVVESVIMRYKSPQGSRATLCVSSQVGCAMGCTFCATGTMGIRGNLSSGEILEQIVHANHILAAEAMERRRITSSIAVPVVAGSAVGEQVHVGEDAEMTNGDDNNKVLVEEEAEEESEGTKENVQNQLQNRRQEKKKRRRRKKTKQDYQSHDLVRNVVFMGMGEPLNNYDNVIAACRGLTDCRRWNLRHGRVTVSTVGVTPKIRKLTQDLPEVALALSLHAPNQEARSAIVPAAKAYHIEDLIVALDEHMMAFSRKNITDSRSKNTKENKDGTADTDKDCGVGGYSEEERKSASKRKRAMIEYVMLEGETSTFECAHQLGKLCENRRLIVNLIPYNQTDVEDKLRCPPREHIDEFQRIVRSYGSFCYIRKTMGADIAGACGQLVVEKEQKSAAAASSMSQSDIEDIGSERGVVSDGTTKKTMAKSRRVLNKQNSSSLPSSTEMRVQEKEEKMADNPSESGDSLEADYWIKPLAIATAVAATCFVISTALLMTRRGR